MKTYKSIHGLTTVLFYSRRQIITPITPFKSMFFSLSREEVYQQIFNYIFPHIVLQKMLVTMLDKPF